MEYKLLYFHLMRNMVSLSTCQNNDII